MATIVYTPGIEFRIATRQGIIDVSEDVIDANVSLNENELHTVRANLINPRRKYDSIFTPMDRFTIKLKRLNWMQVMAGYLTLVPMLSAFPGSVTITGHCSLKRLKYYYWDPGTTASDTLLHSLNTDLRGTPDQGLSSIAMRLVTEVGQWPVEKIHFGEIPSTWFDKVSPLMGQVEGAIASAMATVGASPAIGGGAVTGLGSTTHPDADEAAKIGILPNTSGKVSWFGGPNGGAFGSMALTGEPGGTPDSERPGPGGAYYCAMRWPYAIFRQTGPSSGVTETVLNGTALARSRSWWANRKILVICNRTGKAVCVRAADWGPATWANNRSIDLSQTALEAIGTTDDEVQIRFAPDSMNFGPVTDIVSTGQGSAWDSSHWTGGGTAGGATTPSTGNGGWGPDQPSASEPSTAGIVFRSESRTHNGVTGRVCPQLVAVEQFIRQTWPDAAPGSSYRSVDTVAGPGVSRHTLGRALDIDIERGGSGQAGPEGRALGNAIAYWFATNPKVFGVSQVIWWRKANSGRGWGTLSGDGSSTHAGDPNGEHTNHVHLSFDDTDMSTTGPAGLQGWVDNYNDTFGAEGAFDPAALPSGVPPSLIGAEALPGSTGPNAASNIFTGPLALMNDVPLLDSYASLIQSSMRSFCSAPNGDLIAWFPDYFGMYGTSGVMVVKDIEVLDFGLSWTDEYLKTHQFVAGSALGFGAPEGGGNVDFVRQLITSGVVSIDFPEVVAALFGFESVNADGGIGPPSIDDLNAFRVRILRRFGARPEYTPKSVLTNKPAEFWYAMYLFMRNWASQFQHRIQLTFMPELFPGMLLELADHNLRFYVTGVDHTINFESGFSTNVTVLAPSKINGPGGLLLPAALRGA